MASSQFFTTPLPSEFRSEFSDFEEVGSSSTGHCRVIRTKRNGKWYVLKCLKTEYVNNPLYIKLLGKEFEIGHSLDHPNIAKTIDLIELDEYGPTILMEYIDGMTLNQVTIDKINARSILSELCEALSYAHSKQIIHLDLKPQNILITHNGGHVKLIDFGLSNADHYADIKEVGGTWGYAAPELFSGADATIDLRADIYSVGVIIEQLFAPFVARSVVRRATHPRPEDRYRSIEQMAEAIASTRTLTPRFWLAISLLILIGGCLWWFISIEKTVGETVEETTSQPTIDSVINTAVDSTTVIIAPKVKDNGATFVKPLPTPYPTPEPEPDPLPNPNSTTKVSHEKLKAAGLLKSSLPGASRIPFSTDMEQIFLREFVICSRPTLSRLDRLSKDIERYSEVITQPIPNFEQLKTLSLQIADSFIDSMFRNYDHPKLESECRDSIRNAALSDVNYSKSRFFSGRMQAVQLAYRRARLDKEPLADSISRANPPQKADNPSDRVSNGLENVDKAALVWYQAKFGVSNADIQHFDPFVRKVGE